MTQLELIANDFRKCRPTARDQRNNPDIDVKQVWLADIEHTINCKGWDSTQASAFRELCGAKV